MLYLKYKINNFINDKKLYKLSYDQLYNINLFNNQNILNLIFT